MSTWNEMLETLRGVVAEFMLFLFAVFLVAAAADIILAFTGTEGKHQTIIAMMYIVGAGTMYTSRFFLDRGEWKGFILTGIVAALLQAVAVADVALEYGISLSQTLQGTLAVINAAAVVTMILYVARILYLFGKWRTKRAIRKYSVAGEHREAVKRAEEADSSAFWHKDYIQEPDRLSQSTALALAKSLDAVNRPDDACRIRMVASGWSNKQARSFLDERRIVAGRDK